MNKPLRMMVPTPLIFAPLILNIATRQELNTKRSGNMLPSPWQSIPQDLPLKSSKKSLKVRLRNLRMFILATGENLAELFHL